MTSAQINVLDFSSIVFDSRSVTAGSLFVAIRGTLSDGHNFIEAAIKAGASGIVCEELPLNTNPAVQYFVVKDSHTTLAELAAEFYGNPSHSLKLVGVTGTNGKTTTATLLYSLFTKLGYCCGLLSTVENRIGEEVIPATHTTPNPVELNALLSSMVKRGVQYCFMEVSSHAMVQKRTTSLLFEGGIFTNLTHDHLDYHGTFREYLDAKKSFFDALPKEAFALTNLDDRNGEVMLQNCNARHCTYSLRTLANYRSKIIETHLDGTLLRINETELWVQFLGRFNAYNLTAIYGAAIELGQEPTEVLAAMSQLTSVEGRLQSITSEEGVLAVVDYAHTPDALKNVLETLNEINKSGRIITVVGCGGDRDKDKRPVMARIAAAHSDQIILTSDNPRSEDPNDILAQMAAGLNNDEMKRTLVIESRASAIKTATTLAKPADIVLIAGKGHEKYQEICGVRTHFDDSQEVRIAFGIEKTKK